jgi:LacI family transcriptional regulator
VNRSSPATSAPAGKRRRARNGGPTIHDVAKHAGVSLGTVSNVVNARGNVRPERIRRVQEAIAALGYVPNGVAQSLRRQRSHVVGLVAPSTYSAYFAALLDAFEQIGVDNGYEVMQVLSRHDPALEVRRVRALLARKVDGLIVIPSGEPQPVFDVIAASRVPAIIVDRASSDARFDYVTLDDYRAMTDAAHALLERGHRRLLYVVRYPTLVTTERRIAAFEDAAASVRGARATVMVREASDGAFDAKLGALMTGREAPTAIIGSNSAITLALLRRLRACRIACPRDVSLISFDAPAWAEVTTPPLSVVQPPTDAVAQTAWRLLLARLRQPTRRRERVMLNARLVLRESVATLRETAMRNTDGYRGTARAWRSGRR